MASFHFARRYLGNRQIFFLFLRLLRCFSSPGSLRIPMDSVYGDRGLLRRVSPFRHLRVTGYLLLTAAFRSLSRLSSALSAKASSLRSLQLNLQNSLAILVWSVSHSVALQTWLFLNCFVFPLMLLNGLGCLLFFDDRNVTSFHLPISLFEILRSLTSSILILEIIFNVQFSRYHITCFASYCEKSLRDSRRFHRNALLSSAD